MTFRDPQLLNPVVHCFARCFVCKKLIAIGRNEDDELVLDELKCPHCGVFLDDDQIRTSFAFNTFYTSAISSANKIQSLDPGFVPFLAVGIILTAMGFPTWIRVLNLVFYLFAVVLPILWFRLYWYQVRFDNVEYVEAVSGVKKSFLLWLVATLLNWSLLLIPAGWEITW